MSLELGYLCLLMAEKCLIAFSQDALDLGVRGRLTIVFEELVDFHKLGCICQARSG